MDFGWIGRQAAAITAFLSSSEVMVSLASFVLTYFLTRVLLTTVHRPWLSAYWMLCPVAAVLAGVVVILSALPGYPQWIFLLWPMHPPWMLAVFCLLCLAGAALPAMQTRSCINRIRHIVGRPGQDFEVTADLGPAPGEVGTGRRVVIFCDGTSNRPDEVSDGVPAPTNVWRLYDDLVKSEAQTAWYDAGVGTETSSEAVAGATAGRLAAMVGFLQASQVAGFFVKFRTIIEAAFGVGITENIVQAYSEIVRQYRPGDRIYLIGFSRGSYTARCVAGVIRRCGLLRSENIRYSADVVRLFRTRVATDKNLPIAPEFVHDELPAVEFLGLFDTVGSLGVPTWGWWFNWRLFFRNSPLSTDPSPICVHVYHALAMDERRAQFFPTPFDKTRPSGSWTRTLEEVWFRGAHCDIGGGYADHGLSDIALGWMLDACERHGLLFKGQVLRSLRPDPLARMHDELQRQPAWRLLGSWPRWHPVDTTLHPSVMVRAKAIHALGRHDMTRVDVEPIEFTVSAPREWDRTGLILAGGGARYKLTWKGGQWRDAECPPCGPSGQAGREPVRWLFRFRRRLPRQPYMRLCLTIAHPRRWPLLEGGLARLASYLFWHDPQEMRSQVAPVGRDLEKPRRSVVISNNGADGALYLFANDLWMTAANNSGGVTLTIQRLPDDAKVVGPVWTLTPGKPEKGTLSSWGGPNIETWQWVRTKSGAAGK